MTSTSYTKFPYGVCCCESPCIFNIHGEDSRCVSHYAIVSAPLGIHVLQKLVKGLQVLYLVFL